MCDALKSPGCQTAQRAAAAEERVKVLEGALREIDMQRGTITGKTQEEMAFAMRSIARAALQEDPRDAR